MDVPNEDTIFYDCKTKLRQMRHHFSCSAFQLNRSCEYNCQKIFDWDSKTKMPIMILIQGHNEMNVNHCVGIFNGQIIDGYFGESLKLTQKNFDFAVGDQELVARVVAGFFIDPHFWVKNIVWKFLKVTPDSVLIQNSLAMVTEENTELFIKTRSAKRCNKSKAKTKT